jgi:hypothetical protein
VAICFFLCASAFWLSLFQWYPKADKEKKSKLQLIVVGGCAVIFFGSTLWSVIGIGGISAMTYHMSGTINDADAIQGSLSRRVEREWSVATSLQYLEQQFQTLSNLEEKQGAFSGYANTGDVTIQLESLSKALGNLRTVLQKNAEESRTDLSESKDRVEKLRQIVDEPETPISKRMSDFSKALTSLNEVFQRVQSRQMASFVREISGDLDTFAAVQAPMQKNDVGEAQRAALDRLKATVVAAKQTLKKISEGAESSEEIKLKNLTTISPGMAVIKYAGAIVGEIAAAIALDFFPVIFFIILALTADIRKKEQEEEEGLE